MTTRQTYKKFLALVNSLAIPRPFSVAVDQSVPRDGYTTGMLGKDSPTERERLEAIQRNVDSHTVLVLDGLPMTPSWSCLELGAGVGSIAYWLAERCPEGRVVAVDIDTRYLDPTRASNLEIQQVDVTGGDYAPGGFDLIHARYLFCHLPTRDAMITRAVGWLNPGGWLVAEPRIQKIAANPHEVTTRHRGEGRSRSQSGVGGVAQGESLQRHQLRERLDRPPRQYIWRHFLD